MFEVTGTGHEHGDVVSVAILNRVIVANRASGLNHGGNTGLRSNLDTVGKGEECI